MATTNDAVIKALKSFRAFLNQVLDEGRFRLGGGGPGVSVSIDLTTTEGLLANIEILLIDLEAKDFATEATLALVLGQLANAGGFNAVEWLEDIEADVDGLEGRLDTLIAANAADFATNTAEVTIQGLAIVAQLILNLASTAATTAAVLLGNGTLSDIDANTDGLEPQLQDIEDVLDTIKVDTQAIEVAVEAIEADADIIRQHTKNQQTGILVYSAVVTALANANLRLQFDFGAADSRAKLRNVMFKRTAGAGTPSVDFFVYNQDVAQNISTEFPTSAGSASHEIKVAEPDASPMGGQNVGRLDAGLIVSAAGDVYDLVVVFEVTRDTVPTVTNWGTAHTVASVSSLIVGLDE